MIIVKSKIPIRMATFHLNKKPTAALRFLFISTRGIPPSKVPTGQMYLQNHGFPNPVISITNIGRIITKTARIKNRSHLRYFSPFTLLIFFTKGILKSRSWTKPKGHKKPQTNLPKITPNNEIKPKT